MATTAYHLVLERDSAKQIFAAARDPDALTQFIAELIADDAISDKRFQTGDAWQAIHDQLASAGDDSPLAQTILGGRPLSQDTDRPVILVRPDIVPAVAEALGEYDAAEHTATIQGIGKIFQTAAESQSAVVFAVVSEEG